MSTVEYSFSTVNGVHSSKNRVEHKIIAKQKEKLKYVNSRVFELEKEVRSLKKTIIKLTNKKASND